MPQSSRGLFPTHAILVSNPCDSRSLYLGYAGAGSPCTREVTGEIRVMKMVSALILFAGLLWLISVLVGLSLCAVARRSDDATARMTRDPWLN
ncbi:MAG: hypothetical protein ACJ76X_00815 [Solirubrobacteraceae bacterium]